MPTTRKNKQLSPAVSCSFLAKDNIAAGLISAFLAPVPLARLLQGSRVLPFTFAVLWFCKYISGDPPVLGEIAFVCLWSLLIFILWIGCAAAFYSSDPSLYPWGCIWKSLDALFLCVEPHHLFFVSLLNWIGRNFNCKSPNISLPGGAGVLRRCVVACQALLLPCCLPFLSQLLFVRLPEILPSLDIWILMTLLVGCETLPLDCILVYPIWLHFKDGFQTRRMRDFPPLNCCNSPDFSCVDFIYICWGSAQRLPLISSQVVPHLLNISLVKISFLLMIKGLAFLQAESYLWKHFRLCFHRRRWRSRLQQHPWITWLPLLSSTPIQTVSCPVRQNIYIISLRGFGFISCQGYRLFLPPAFFDSVLLLETSGLLSWWQPWERGVLFSKIMLDISGRKLALPYSALDARSWFLFLKKSFFLDFPSLFPNCDSSPGEQLFCWLLPVCRAGQGKCSLSWHLKPLEEIIAGTISSTPGKSLLNLPHVMRSGMTAKCGLFFFVWP